METNQEIIKTVDEYVENEDTKDECVQSEFKEEIESEYTNIKIEFNQNLVETTGEFLGEYKEFENEDIKDECVKNELKEEIESESTKKEIKFNQTFIDITVDMKECSSVKRKFGNEVDYHEPLNKI